VKTTPEEELRRLAEGGVSPSDRVWVTHFFSHFTSSEEERRTFREALVASGFGSGDHEAKIGTDEEVTGDGLWHHWSFTVLQATPEILTAADAKAAQVAADHGVRYDGWKVQREIADNDGPPRPVLD
jgi:hypothetical protein